MNAVRRSALTLALTFAAVLGSTSSTAPAQASFADSASRTTAITTATVAAPGNVTGSLACGRSTATMGTTWNLSPSARISGYRVTVYFSDGFVQTVELGPTATSWSSSIDVYFVTAFSVQYSVTTKTDYGWSKESARTGTFQC
jgi:hypothetical protein